MDAWRENCTEANWRRVAATKEEAKKFLLDCRRKDQKGIVLTCPYCGGRAYKTNSYLVYGTEKYGDMWVCENWPDCDARCGCHADGKPVGTLANEELRTWRKRAHSLFDRLWKGGVDRKTAYRLLCQLMGITKEEAHIAKFGIEECRKLVEIMEEKDER